MRFFARLEQLLDEGLGMYLVMGVLMIMVLALIDMGIL